MCLIDSKVKLTIKIINSFIFLIWIVGVNVVNATESETERFTGYWEIGFRSVDLDGSENKYRQHLNMDNGFWLSGLGMVFLPEEKSFLTPDRIEFSASNLGSEPYQNLRLDIRKYGSYRLSYKRQKSEYFYQDILIDAEDENPEMSNGGDFHHFDFDRVRDHFNLNVNLGDQSKLLLDLNQYSKKGESTTVLDISREEFELEQPIDQKLKNYNLGFEQRWDKTAIKINQRWRDFNNDVEIFLLSPSEGSAPMDPTRLDSFYLEQPYGYNSRETQLDFTIRPSQSWVVQLNGLYADLDMDLDSLELASGLDFIGDSLQLNLTGEGQSKRTVRQNYIGASYSISDFMRFRASFRDQSLEQYNTLDLDGVISENQWSIESSTSAIGLESIFQNHWTLTGGLTIEDRLASYITATESNVEHEKEKTQNNGYYLILGYRPKTGLLFNASVEKNIIDDPFTLSSPTDSQYFRLKLAYKWDNDFKLSSSYVWRKSENDLSGWKANSKQTNLRLSYSNDPIMVAMGTTIVDVDRSIDQLVTGGFVQALFPIYYRADSDFWDGMIRWKVSPKTSVTTQFRRYDNKGSFEVKRNDARIGINFELLNEYNLGTNYRYIDYNEDFEDFKASIFEVTIGRRW